MNEEQNNQTQKLPEENKIVKIIQKIDFYDKSLAIILLIIVIVQIYLFSQLAHLSSPLYGGDLYRERGFVQYILNGNHYWTDPYFKGELEFYPPLGYILAALIVGITGLSIDKIINFLPIAVTILIPFAFYKLGQTIFKRKDLAFILALAALTQNMFQLKFTYGLSITFAIMFITYFFKLETQQNTKTKILAGLFLGLTSLSHYEPFLYTTVMITATIFLEFAYKIKTQKTPIKTTKETIKKYLLTFTIAITISMIFFAPLIIKYHLKTLNKTQEYSLFDVNKNGIGWLTSTVFNQFIQTTNAPNFLLGIFGIIGIIACMLNKNKTEQRFSIFLLIGMIISGGHYLITKPLLNMWIVPPHMISGLFIPFLILSVWGIKFLIVIIEKNKAQKGKYVLPVITLLIILPLINSTITNYNNDKWTQYGRQMDPTTQTFYDMGNWILSTTTNNDVFLANDEAAFALNALTGRQVVTVRRTHASPYADVDKRYADTIVMLYGNNTTKVKELLKEYSVTYILFEQFLLTQPMITSTRYTNYLKQNGINFTIQNVSLDPAGVDTPQYESIVVPPQELKIVNITNPMKQFNTGNQPIAIIYGIK